MAPQVKWYASENIPFFRKCNFLKHAAKNQALLLPALQVGVPHPSILALHGELGRACPSMRTWCMLPSQSMLSQRARRLTVLLHFDSILTSADDTLRTALVGVKICQNDYAVS